MSGKHCFVLWGVFITVVLQSYIPDHSKQLVQNELENVADKTCSQPSNQNKGMHFSVKSWVKFKNVNFMIAWVWLIKIYTHVADLQAIFCLKKASNWWSWGFESGNAVCSMHDDTVHNCAQRLYDLHQSYPPWLMLTRSPPAQIKLGGHTWSSIFHAKVAKTLLTPFTRYLLAGMAVVIFFVVHRSFLWANCANAHGL